MKLIAFIFLVNASVLFAQDYPFFRDQTTTIKDPFSLRDPFKKPRYSKKNSKSEAIEEKKYSFKNIKSINKTPLSKIKIVGILLGRERRAIAKISKGANTLSKESYILKEGMTLGEGDAILKAILPGGIVVVEKIKNIYDQEEFLETVIPVSR